MNIGVAIFAILMWAIGLFLLFFPIYISQGLFRAPKKLRDHYPQLFDKEAKDFLDTLYTDPNALEKKFPGVNMNTRIGGVICLLAAIGLTCKLFL